MSDCSLIIIDGINNSGKTTIISALKERLLENGMTFEAYNEPYFTNNRKLLLSGELDNIQEYVIFKEDRFDLYNNIINKACKHNDFIIIDRSCVSSLVYQSILQEDYDMFWKITKDISKLYSDKTVDIGINLYASPQLAAMRKKNSIDSEYDYRDTDNIDKIKSEINAYKISWNTFLSLGIVRNYFEFKNDNFYDLNKIINKLDEKILEIHREKE